jgi:hypothetical protein
VPVFISHKSEDTSNAIMIANYLRSRGVQCYVDVLDPTIKTTDDLTKLLMSRVKQCSHLMAVVSTYTTQSWWVPFEIGVGSELDRRITSYKLSYVDLPDFLKKWPILSSLADLDSFVSIYKRDASIDFSEGRILSSIQTSGTFHAELKNALRQY